jgi:hypothetical protein
MDEDRVRIERVDARRRDHERAADVERRRELRPGYDGAGAIERVARRGEHAAAGARARRGGGAAGRERVEQRQDVGGGSERGLVAGAVAEVRDDGLGEVQARGFLGEREGPAVGERGGAGTPVPAAVAEVADPGARDGLGVDRGTERAGVAAA